MKAVSLAFIVFTILINIAVSVSPPYFPKDEPRIFDDEKVPAIVIGSSGPPTPVSWNSKQDVMKGPQLLPVGRLPANLENRWVKLSENEGKDNQVAIPLILTRQPILPPSIIPIGIPPVEKKVNTAQIKPSVLRTPEEDVRQMLKPPGLKILEPRNDKQNPNLPLNFENKFVIVDGNVAIPSILATAPMLPPPPPVIPIKNPSVEIRPSSILKSPESASEKEDGRQALRPYLVLPPRPRPRPQVSVWNDQPKGPQDLLIKQSENEEQNRPVAIPSILATAPKLPQPPVISIKNPSVEIRPSSILKSPESASEIEDGRQALRPYLVLPPRPRPQVSLWNDKPKGPQALPIKQSENEEQNRPVAIPSILATAPKLPQPPVISIKNPSVEIRPSSILKSPESASEIEDGRQALRPYLVLPPRPRPQVSLWNDKPKGPQALPIKQSENEEQNRPVAIPLILTTASIEQPVSENGKNKSAVSIPLILTTAPIIQAVGPIENPSVKTKPSSILKTPQSDSTLKPDIIYPPRPQISEPWNDMRKGPPIVPISRLPTNFNNKWVKLSEDEGRNKPVPLIITTAPIPQPPVIKNEGYDVFFPLSSVRLTIPTNEKALSIFTKIPFGKFQVVSLANNGPADSATNYTYSLEKSDEGDEGDECLQINNSTGEVLLTEAFQNTKHNSRYIVSAKTTTEETKPSFKMPHMSVEIVPTNSTEFCGQLENLCYWSGAHYTVKEDRPDVSFRPVRIGKLRPNGFNYLCSEFDVSYKLMASEFLTVKEETLYTKKPIDHESHSVSTNGVFADVKCFAKKLNGEPMELIKRINVTVLDRNDNGPKLQNNEKLEFKLEDPHFQMDDPIGEKIYFLDGDTLETNSHITYEVQNDKFNLIRPICNAYESDHNEKRSSIVSCQLVFARNGLLNITPYCFGLEASDLTIDSIHQHSARANICIHTDLSKIHESNRPTAEALRSSRQHRRPSKIVNSEESLVGLEFGLEAQSILPITFTKDVYVYRTAMQWNRVVQPTNMVDLINVTKLKFRIEEDRSGAFGITERAGILFVKNTTALLNAIETVYFVTVKWTDTYNRSFIVNIHLRDGRPANTSCEHKEKSRTQTCAQIKWEKQCTKFCGLATDGGACNWRGVNNGFTRNYASCVPNRIYCPDNICDPLEGLDVFACPQDCFASNKIMGPHTTNDNKRGILSASGTCICEDNGKCSCAPLDEDDMDRPRKGRKKNQTKESAKFSFANASTDPSTVMDSPGIICGTSCIIFTITCPSVLIIIITCLFFSRRKYKQNVKGKSLSPKDIRKGDCDARNGDLPLMLMENSFKFDSDTKWEIARDRLILDTTLGEGEFGKVFKGYATDIDNCPGVTTVAVKMLKNGANSVEYMALLSEFQLLQEVSHPNVIKLLGACTKSDSPMIIIEYARYGSLRGYLRLSRKIECAGVDFTDGVEPVTVRDILSFAWQICKGMAYLTEIKLVHRDLAARNILLAENKICKISDFGLTRDVYEDDAYLKRSRDRVPVKWMAPESLADHVYTTKSDVWSFGVLCWELITLGASPYPGIPPQNLYHLLKTGYRMERPENCSEEIYTIVRSCWVDDPNSRPSFKYIASEFEKLLGNNAKYIEIEANAVSNPLYFSEDTTNRPNDLSQLTDDLGEPDSLEHLWHSPKISYDTTDNCNSKESGVSTNPEFLPPPGYDMPRPLIESNTTEQILRYENDLRFPLNVRKSIRGSTPIIDPSHYAVPVKRGRSYIDMTNKTFIPDNLNNNDVEKNISKNISFRFSSLLNLNEQDNIV